MRTRPCIAAHSVGAPITISPTTCRRRTLWRIVLHPLAASPPLVDFSSIHRRRACSCEGRHRPTPAPRWRVCHPSSLTGPIASPPKSHSWAARRGDSAAAPSLRRTLPTAPVVKSKPRRTKLVVGLILTLIALAAGGYWEYRVLYAPQPASTAQRTAPDETLTENLPSHPTHIAMRSGLRKSLQASPFPLRCVP